jgi:hypothetical protein
MIGCRLVRRLVHGTVCLDLKMDGCTLQALDEVLPSIASKKVRLLLCVATVPQQTCLSSSQTVGPSCTLDTPHRRWAQVATWSCDQTLGTLWRLF